MALEKWWILYAVSLDGGVGVKAKRRADNFCSQWVEKQIQINRKSKANG